LYAPVFVSLWRRFRRLLLASLVIALVAGALYWIADEVQTSRGQAELISKLARELQYKVEPGPSMAIRFPGAGPYDQRLGYHLLPKLVERLTAQGYTVTAQARMSPRLIELSDQGLFITYREKDQAGSRCATAAALPCLPRASRSACTSASNRCRR